MKKSIFLLLFVLFALDSFCQDSTDTTGGSGFRVSGSLGLWLGILVAVYEVLARMIPTLKNYSIIGFIIQVIQKILPNNSATAKKLP